MTRSRPPAASDSSASAGRQRRSRSTATTSAPALRSARAHPGEAERQGGGNTHAWLQVYLPGAGWVDFDPTNGIVGSRGLIRVAVVRDPSMAIPLSGSWTGASADCLGMDVSVRVTEMSPILQTVR